MKKIETTKYKCDFCEFNSHASKWVEEHEKQKHTCKHKNIYYDISTPSCDWDNDITIYKKCKDCYVTLEIIEKDMDNFSDEDKQKIWDIFVKYKD